MSFALLCGESLGAGTDQSFDKYFPYEQYPKYSSTEESREQNQSTPDDLLGGIKNLSQEIQRSVKDVTQKRNLTCFGDPCLFQFFPLAYTRAESGFFGGVHINVTNIASQDPYSYAVKMQVIRSDSDQWVSTAKVDIPEINIRILKPRVKLRGSYSRSTEFRYTGQGLESYSLKNREDRDKRYSLKEKGAGATLLIPLAFYSQSHFGFYGSYDYNVVKNDPFVDSSILFSKKPEAYKGGTYRSLALGLYHDNRDNMSFARSGRFIELGFGVGALDDTPNIIYRANLADRRYHSKGRWTLAHRFTFDGLFGKVPFWEQRSVGGIDPIKDVSGSGLLKGAKGGRFHENIKVIEALELRIHQNEFRAYGQRGDLALIPLATEFGLLSRLGVWSLSSGLDILWNKSFLTRFYTSFSEDHWTFRLKFDQEF
jgi:hypothetical protein